MDDERVVGGRAFLEPTGKMGRNGYGESVRVVRMRVGAVAGPRMHNWRARTIGQNGRDPYPDPHPRTSASKE